MMYVAKLNGKSTSAQYAVAVRGTVGAAPLDWLMDDFDIFRMMPWPLGSRGHPWRMDYSDGAIANAQKRYRCLAVSHYGIREVGERPSERNIATLS